MKHKGLGVILSIILMVSLATPAMAVENRNSFTEDDSFVDISNVQEQELIELPATYAEATMTGETRIVSAKLLKTEEAELEIDDQLSEDSSARAATWDWWAYDVTVKREDYQSDEVLSLNRDEIFIVRIANMGTTHSPQTTARIELSDRPSGGTQFIGGSFTVNPCEPYSIKKEVSYYEIIVNLASPAGGHTLAITVNPSGAQAENDNYTNRTEGSFTWGNSSTFIDPAYFDVRPVDNPDSATLPIGVATQFEFFVSNYGNASTQNVPVYVVFYDNDLAYFATTDIVLSSIPAGHARRFTASIKFMYSGVKTIIMEVDPYGAIVDHNRDNNSGEKDFTMEGTQAGMEYGALYFAYPLPSEWTGYYPRTNHPGNGLDLNAPKGTPIYSVDSGDVIKAGFDNQRGHFVIVTNDTLDPYNDQPLHTRYLHMWKSPDVVEGQSLNWKQKIGEVGNTGAYVIERRNHLHIDLNSSGYIDTTIPESAGITPKLFYPYVNFYADTTEKSFQFVEDFHDISDEAMYANGGFIDATIIKIIGDETFSEWLENTPEESQTVYKLVGDFDLSWEELQNVVHASTYAKYIEHMPN